MQKTIAQNDETKKKVKLKFEKMEIITVTHKSSWSVSMKPLGMQLKIQNDESSLQNWHVESSSCAAVASGFMWVIHVLHFCRRCSMNLEGGQLHMMLIPVASCFTCVFYVHRDL